MNDAQTFDHESPQGDMTFGSAIGLKFTLAFPGAFMKKILPAVLMLCALAAGSQPVCAATDNQLMREEITAGITDPAVIEGSADAFGFSGEKAGLCRLHPRSCGKQALSRPCRRAVQEGGH